MWPCIHRPDRNWRANRYIASTGLFAGWVRNHSRSQASWPARTLGRTAPEPAERSASWADSLV